MLVSLYLQKGMTQASPLIDSTVYALGELAVMYPVSGGFYTYSTRFIDPSWGFAMGWNYVFQWAVVLPLELVVASVTTQYWNKDIDPAVWIAIFLAAIIAINVFGVLGYAEEEFWSSILKLGAIIAFMIIGLVLGKSKNGHRIRWISPNTSKSTRWRAFGI